MPNYLTNVLQKFQHPPPCQPQYSPHPTIPIQYGAKMQTPTPLDTTPKVAPAEITLIEQIIGSLLH